MVDLDEVGRVRNYFFFDLNFLLVKCSVQLARRRLALSCRRLSIYVSVTKATVRGRRG